MRWITRVSVGLVGSVASALGAICALGHGQMITAFVTGRSASEVGGLDDALLTAFVGLLVAGAGIALVILSVRPKGL